MEQHYLKRPARLDAGSVNRGGIRGCPVEGFPRFLNDKGLPGARFPAAIRGKPQVAARVVERRKRKRCVIVGCIPLGRIKSASLPADDLWYKGPCAEHQPLCPLSQMPLLNDCS